MYISPKVYSSYSDNDLGKTLYDFVLKTKPNTIIEFGVLNGYSTIAMALALKKLGRGKIIGYDLWEKYPYRHSTMDKVQKTLEEYGVQDFVELREGDFYDWKPEKYDMMHVDISNDGKTINWLSQIHKKHGGNILFEGGSEERDNVEWMIKYGNPPINGCEVDYKILNKDFPSISKIV